MLKYSTSKKLISSVKHFFDIKYYSFFEYISKKKGIFYGWARRRSGVKAVYLAQKYNTPFRLLEDGFIRSVGLGVDNSPSFSIVEDDLGIYYDARFTSRLEQILQTHDFKNDTTLKSTAQEAINLIKKFHISKYNNSKDVGSDFFPNDTKEKVLVIAQTAGDASLAYGMGDQFSTQEMMEAAISENQGAKIYLKIHPDVLCGKKKSDIDINHYKEHCIVISENVNPISLLKNFNKVYTKTSQMGFEALLVGCQCVCFGMPFYAGWGITDDRVQCKRRKRKLCVRDVFAGAYILYTHYYNPYAHRSSDIIDTIFEIQKQKKLQNTGEYV